MCEHAVGRVHPSWCFPLLGLQTSQPRHRAHQSTVAHRNRAPPLRPHPSARLPRPTLSPTPPPRLAAAPPARAPVHLTTSDPVPLHPSPPPPQKHNNRGYSREAYDALVARARAAVPGMALSTDIICGARAPRPGRRRGAFGRLLALRGAGGRGHLRGVRPGGVYRPATAGRRTSTRPPARARCAAGKSPTRKRWRPRGAGLEAGLRGPAKCAPQDAALLSPCAACPPNPARQGFVGKPRRSMQRRWTCCGQRATTTPSCSATAGGASGWGGKRWGFGGTGEWRRAVRLGWRFGPFSNRTS